MFTYALIQSIVQALCHRQNVALHGQMHWRISQALRALPPSFPDNTPLIAAYISVRDSLCRSSM